MKTANIDLSRDLKFLEIHTIADLHIGEATCDMNHVKARIEAVRNNQNAYAVINGDLINNATKSSVSDIYSEVLSPMDALNKATELLKPIKDKIIAMCGGNHENRTYKTDGIDLTRLIARELGVEDRYSENGIVVFIRFGERSDGRKETKSGEPLRMTYSGYIVHGNGGGKSEGAKINRLAYLAGIVDTDFYIHAHTHLPLTFKSSFARVSQCNGSVSMVDKLFVNSGASLNYGGYGEAMSFKPSSKCTPIIYLSGTKREMRATL